MGTSRAICTENVAFDLMSAHRHRTIRKALTHAGVALCQVLDPRKRLNVYTLHRIGPNGAPLSPETVEHQLRLLSRTHDFILPRDILDHEGPHERHLALLTVDDGHASAFEHIFPICRRLALPFAIYLPVDFIDRRRWLWFDKLDYIMTRKSSMDPTFHSSHRTERLIDEMRGMLPAERDRRLDALAASLGVDIPEHPVADYRPLTRAQIEELADSGLVEFGSHTVSHTILTLLEDTALARELTESRQALQALTGQEVSTFCYPNGRPGDFDQKTERAVRRAGYRAALTSVEGSNLLSRINKMEIKRIHLGLPDHALLKESCGLAPIQKRLRARHR